MAQSAAKKAFYPETIAELQADERNPRKIGDEAAAGLRASLSEFGDIGGITFNLRTGKLVSGHQRVDQLKRQYGHNVRIVPPKDKSDRGYIECPNGDLFAVRFVDWPEDRARLANVAANNPHIAGEFDESLSVLLAELSGEFGNEIASLRLDKLLDECDFSDVEPPDEFQEVDEDIETEHTCPKCGYKFSGGS